MTNPRSLPPCPIPPPPEPIKRAPDGKMQKGNRGRPPGSRNKRTIALEQLFRGEAEEVARVAIDLAKRGDVTAVKLILDRIAPARKGATIELPDFPRVQSIADVPAAHAFLIGAVAGGRITPDESAAIAATIDRYRAAVETIDFDKRLAALEAQYAKPNFE